MADDQAMRIRGSGYNGGLMCGGMPGFLGLVFQVMTEGRLMIEDGRVFSQFYGILTKSGIGHVGEHVTHNGFAYDVGGRHHTAILQNDILAVFQRLELGIFRDTGFGGTCGVNLPRFVGLLETVSDTIGRVLHFSRFHGELIFRDHHDVFGSEGNLMVDDIEAQVQLDRGKGRIQEGFDALRGHNAQGPVAPLKLHGRDQSGQPEKMISIQMGDEDVIDLGSLHTGLQHAHLCVFATIEKEDASIPP